MEEVTEPEHIRPAPETTPPTFTVSLTVQIRTAMRQFQNFVARLEI